MGFLSVLGWIFLWILIVLFALVFLLFLLSLPKAKVRLFYDGKISVGIKYLFISKTLTDGEKKEAPEKEATEKTEKPKEKKPAPRFLQNIKISDWLSLVKILFTDFIFKIKIEKFDFDAKIATDNAADTALLYGKISAATYPIISFLAAKEVIKKANVNIYSDFLSEKSEFRGEAVASVRLITLIYTAIKAGIYLLTRDSLPENTTKQK